ncbi:helix-turn-helix transcriptional regulator [Kluyvera ascorbata]|uniref:helix-turn-helix transcriptional regulator n=1 Tax=Kluyvera ascorbata TaxID=51288 RepID=UPI0039F6C5AD
MIQPEIMNALASVVPELSRKQLEVATLYANGTGYDSIADICNISVETVRSHLKRSTKALNLESNEAMRAVILLRSNFLIISMLIAK